MKPSFIQTIKTHWIIVIVVFAYTALLSYKLIAFPRPFYDWDESIYVEVGKEMVVHGSATPLWQGEAWLEKPPLAPLLYGVLIEFAPGQPEITTRLFSLFLSAIALGLVYLWVLRATKNRYLAVLTSVILGCNPTFLQRAQTVNTDVFLLIGWLGYLFTFPRFWLSLGFLFIGVFSKSLLGFYPVAILGLYDVYRFLLDRKYKKTVLEHMRVMSIQIGLILIWFAGMIIVYGQQFIQVHFIDHMLRRVTSSIESHFGKRTYYFDLVFIDYGYYSLIAMGGAVLLAYQRLKKKISDDQLLTALFLLPWFLFLNLTKTKISWYIYPALPQIALLMVYPLKLMERFKTIIVGITLILTVVIVYRTYKGGNLLGSYYSSYDDTYKLSLFTARNCDNLAILIDKDGRQTYEVLSGMNLTISTSAIYGNHPSVVYYSSKPVSYIYNKDIFVKRLAEYPAHSCVAIEDKDTDAAPTGGTYIQMQKFDGWTLYRKNQ